MGMHPADNDLFRVALQGSLLYRQLKFCTKIITALVKCSSIIFNADGIRSSSITSPETSSPAIAYSSFLMSLGSLTTAFKSYTFAIDESASLSGREKALKYSGKTAFKNR